MYIMCGNKAASYCVIAETEHGDVSKDDRRAAFLDGWTAFEFVVVKGPFGCLTIVL
jgi:hypothetical protein